MWSSTWSVSLAVPAYSASSSARSETEPATSAATIGRLGADDGHLRDGVLLQDRDRLGDGLAGVGVHQVGQPAVLAAQHLADGLGAVAVGRAVGKPYCASHSSLKTLVR